MVALFKNNFLWLAILSDVLGLLFVVCNGLRPLYWKSGMGASHIVDASGEEHMQLLASTKNDDVTTKKGYGSIA